MRCPSLAQLPPPPAGKTGWPWTEETPPLAATRPDGSLWPRISIVTPSYNQGQFIEETIRSVLLQGYPDLEYIIIDGGSSDETVEIIKKYEPWLSYWTSEKDRGQAHAINKGIERISGEVFNWINSDDLLLPGALKYVGEMSAPNRLLASAVLNSSERGHFLVCNKGLTAAQLISGRGAVFHQPGLWLWAKNLKDVGPLNETLNFAFDYHLVTKYLSRFPQVVYSDRPTAKFRLHDASKTVSMQPLFHDDRMQGFRLIMADPRYRDLHGFCADRLKWDAWARQVRSLSGSASSKWKIVLLLVWGTIQHPRVRFSRFTLGAIRDVLFSKKKVAENEAISA
jgi:glycosyltransferase involved in cell wall biosynthesis